MKVVLFGATGNVGKVINKELVERNHDLTVVVRDKDKFTESAKNILVGDINSYEKFIANVEKDSVVISSMGPVFGKEEEFDEIMKNLIEFSKKVQAKRVIVVGGAGSLYVTEDLRLVDSEGFPNEWKPIANAHIRALELLENSNINWTYFSPAAFFEPGEKTGDYRLGGTKLIADEMGNSKISFGDYAKALVDELEIAQNEKKQFTIGY